MASITTSVNYSDLLNFGDGEDITISSGAVLTIDAPTPTIGQVTFPDGNGELRIDGRSLRILNYMGGSGTPSLGDTLTQAPSGVTGKIVNAGTGYVQLQGVSGSFVDGQAIASTGFTATADGADDVGLLWLRKRRANSDRIETAGSATFSVYGERKLLGTSDGTASQSFSLPLSIPMCVPQLWVETGSGTGAYELWRVLTEDVGLITQIPSSGELSRYYSQTFDTSTITFGDGSTGGAIPPNGARIFIANTGMYATDGATSTAAYISSSSGAIARLVLDKGGNITLNTALLCMFDFTLAGLTTLSITDTGVLGYLNSLKGPVITGGDSSIIIPRNSSSAFVDIQGGGINGSTGQLYVETPQAFSIVSAALSGNIAIVQSESDANIDLNNCSFNCTGFLLVGKARATALTGTIGGMVYSAGKIGTNQSVAMELSSSSNLKFNGFQYAVGGGRGVEELFLIVACSNLEFVDFGTFANPLDLESTQDRLFEVGALCSGLLFKNCHIENRAEASFFRIDASSGFEIIQCSNGAYTEDFFSDVVNTDNRQLLGVAADHTLFPTTLSVAKGSAWYATFDSSTTGAIGIFFTDPASTIIDNGSFAVNAGSASFSGDGTLSGVSGDQVTYISPSSAFLGYNGANDITVAGTSTGNITVEYEFFTGTSPSGTWTAANATNLVAETIASSGVKVAIRLTWTGAGSLNRLFFGMDTITDAIANIDYDISERITLTLTGIPSGAEVRIYDLDATLPSLGTELAGTEANSGTNFAYSYVDPGNDIWVQVIATGFEEYGQSLTLSATPSSFPVSMEVETNI